MSRRERIALLLCVVVPGLFVVFEAAALVHRIPIFGWIVPWDTISFYAQRDFRLDVAIIVLACGALVAFLGWWIHHMRTKILR